MHRPAALIERQRGKDEETAAQIEDECALHISIIASILTPSGSRATLFNFVSECRPNIPIAQGDARLTIANALDASCDLILVGAFLGAAIPIHLLTKEAMAVYLRKLKPNGIVAMHVSYYHLELATVVAGIADSNGAITRLYGGDVQEDASKQKWIPAVAEVARKDPDFGALANSKFWPVCIGSPQFRLSGLAGANVDAGSLEPIWELRIAVHACGRDEWAQVRHPALVGARQR